LHILLARSIGVKTRSGADLCKLQSSVRVDVAVKIKVVDPFNASRIGRKAKVGL
jgi:hypothetical protein